MAPCKSILPVQGRVFGATAAWESGGFVNKASGRLLGKPRHLTISQDCWEILSSTQPCGARGIYQTIRSDGRNKNEGIIWATNQVGLWERWWQHSGFRDFLKHVEATQATTIADPVASRPWGSPWQRLSTSTVSTVPLVSVYPCISLTFLCFNPEP